MKYTIEIPTIETLETLNALASHKVEAWLLEEVTKEMTTRAEYGYTDLTLDLEHCPYVLSTEAMYGAQNTLREMGYMTTYRPRCKEFIVEWSITARSNLQQLKDNNVAWKFPTREEIEEWEARRNEILKKTL